MPLFPKEWYYEAYLSHHDYFSFFASPSFPTGIRESKM